MRKKVAEVQNLKFQEWVHYEETISKRSIRIKHLTTENLQHESTKIYYIGRHKVQADFELEITSELKRKEALLKQKQDVQKALEEASEQILQHEDRLQ